MKKFLIKITAYGYITEFTVEAENSSQGLENAILDKLGKNDINWDNSDFYDRRLKWLTFEEVKESFSSYLIKSYITEIVFSLQALLHFI